MMDAAEGDPGGVPAGLIETTDASLRESDRLAGAWHGAAGGRLRYAYAPRFALSCTQPLLRAVGERTAPRTRAPAAPEATRRPGAASERRSVPGVLAHIHASEQRSETEAVRARLGKPNIVALADLRLVHSNAVLAHCVWPEPDEIGLLASLGAHVAHCPSANLKLASGIAPIRDYLAAGVNVGLGSDGAACNNLLDAWEELRLAALLAKLAGGAGAIPAQRVFELATLSGARALGLATEIGSLEPGKWADLVIVDLRRPHAFAPDPEGGIYTQLVYGTRAGDVRGVMVAGRLVVENGALTSATGLDVPLVLERAAGARRAALARAASPSALPAPAAS
jgi:cytosine/adenosine deaminase-related metal-dependent hydrolase